jgi:hypothetical protein
MLFRLQDVFPKDYVGIGQLRSETLDDSPLSGARLHGVNATHPQVRGRDNNVRPTGCLAKKVLQSGGSVVRVLRQLRRPKDVVCDLFDRLVHRQHAVSLTKLLFLGAVRGDPFGDVTLLLLV